MLTAAVSGRWQIVEDVWVKQNSLWRLVPLSFFFLLQSYLISQVSAPLDFINVMTYGWIDPEFTYTRHHSPMYALDVETEEGQEYYGWNTDFAMNYWLDGGAEREKLMVGISTYGIGYRLADPNDHGLYAPASGSSGMLGFNEWCEIRDGYTVVRVRISFA